MNYFAKITIISSVAVCIGVGAFFIPNMINNKEETESKTDYSEIYNKIESKTEIKKVQFDTAEEMFEYAESITKINGIEEATSFLTEFLEICSTGKPEVMLTYYNSSLWENVLDNNIFPFYDSTGSVLFKATDITVEEGDKENEYIANYTVIAVDSETNETLAELKRKDTFVLYKDFEVIKIINYSRKTVDEKYY